MAKILSVYNRLQAGDYENGNGGKRRVSRLTQFIHTTLQLLCRVLWIDFDAVFTFYSEGIALSDAPDSAHFRR